MADFTATYVATEFESTLPGPRTDVGTIDGPAQFLALAVSLGVPVMARKQLGGGGVRAAGGGLSFAVARTDARLQLRKGMDWANEIPPDWFDGLETQGNDPEAVIVKNHVNKRITLPRDFGKNEEREIDARVLAAITTEVKILAHEGIRKSNNIISLLAISWNTRETNGHFLPEIFLEGAQHGSLDQYLRVTSNMSACSKALMLTDIASGLTLLHANGIVHCDVKPGNLLVCDSPERKCLESIGLEPVIVKICDFGCSVILSDYPVHYRFAVKVGTPGWMAPEMEQGVPIELGMLRKADIYSLGLVSGAILTGVKPSSNGAPHLAKSEDLPGTELDGEASCSLPDSGKESPTRPPKRKACDADKEYELPDSRRVLFEKFASGAEFPAWMNQETTEKSNADDSNSGTASMGVVPRPEPLDEHQSDLLREILSWTLQPVPSNRKDAREVYDLCRARLLSKDYSSHGEILGALVTSSPFENNEGTRIQVKSNDAGVPDFAFENMLQTAAIPRQCRMEVFRDLERRVAHNTSDAGDSAFQLAALAANGYLNCNPDKLEEEIERYLVSAVGSGSQLAACGAINVLDAMGRKVPQDLRRQILFGFRDHGFQLQAVYEVKSIFFRLSFLPEVEKPKIHGPMRLPFAYKHRVPSKLIGFRTWKKEFKEQFDDFLQSQDYHQILSVLPVGLLEAQVDWPNPGSPRLSNTAVAKYIHDSFATLDNMEPYDRDSFVDEVLEREMVNEPTDVGLTLLQLAATRGDEATASVLLDTLCADVDGCGITENWTPLWLACFLGHIDMATFLLGHGAGITCTDSHGLTLLHLLSQFMTKEGVEGIGYQTLAAGVDINAKTENGITPLLAAMLVFDYSSGAVIEFLLENGADPLEPTLMESELCPLPISPLTICILNLDVDLLEQMLSTIPPHSGDVRKTFRVSLEQDVGFHLMRSQTTFNAMFETGSKYRMNLMRTLQAVVTLERTGPFWREASSTSLNSSLTPLEASTTLFHTAFLVDRTDLAEMLLIMEPNLPLEMATAEANQRQVPMIDECVVRQNFRAFNMLTRHGANLLEPLGMGETVLSRISKEAPAMLFNALDHLENLPIIARGNKTVKQILEVPQLDTSGIFDGIILNGVSDDLTIAEALRLKYHLNHDRVQPYPENTTTLMGALIVWTQSYGYDRVAQIRYLLTLEPKPRFVMPSGVNLFSLAVIVLSGKASDAEYLMMLRLLFNAYPNIENLTQGWRHQLPALHRAAAGTNLEVLQLMREHIELKHPGKTLPYNYTHLRNEISAGAALITALDCCRFGMIVPEFDTTATMPSTKGDEGILGVTAFEQQVESNQRAVIYRYLRDQGAVHGWELDGYFIRQVTYSLVSYYTLGRILWANALPADVFHEFLEKLTKKYSLDPWEHGPEPEQEYPYTWFPFAWRHVEREVAETLSPAIVMISPKTVVRICELVWRGNNFALHAWDLPFLSPALSIYLKFYFSTRVYERKRWVKGDGATPPYNVTSFHESFSLSDEDGTHVTSYTRHGRVWTEIEVSKLSDDIFGEWAKEFSAVEEDVPAELRAIAMSYF